MKIGTPVEHIPGKRTDPSVSPFAEAYTAAVNAGGDWVPVTFEDRDALRTFYNSVVSKNRTSRVNGKPNAFAVRMRGLVAYIAYQSVNGTDGPSRNGQAGAQEHAVTPAASAAQKEN